MMYLALHGTARHIGNGLGILLFVVVIVILARAASGGDD